MREWMNEFAICIGDSCIQITDDSMSPLQRQFRLNYRCDGAFFHWTMKNGYGLVIMFVCDLYA